jgi:hypothetical protein
MSSLELCKHRTVALVFGSHKVKTGYASYSRTFMLKANIWLLARFLKNRKPNSYSPTRENKYASGWRTAGDAPS